NTGLIWRYTGTPLTGWELLDNNPATVEIVAAGGHLYQRHGDGTIWRYTGTPLTGWELLDNNPATVDIVAAGGQLYQRHDDATIWRFTGLVLSDLDDLDAAGCDGGTSGEQDRLFALRNGCGANDLVAYLVRSVIQTTPGGGALNGCASHPAGEPGAAVARIASQWTLAHEMGHVLGLPHISGEKDAAGNCISPDFTRLMTGCSTSNIVGIPTVSASEIATMTSSAFVFAL
ncbi:hypothetical protein, partial [Cellulomonas chitinilytica]|uniref:hypothetical protein n=1 Tax=Cellulomonas chitinilytica TaxID=398759 RepID=UPI001944BB32